LPSLRKDRMKRKRTTRKKPRRHPNADRLDTLDAIDERCERIETLAGLLRVCDDPSGLDCRLAARTGCFIEKELHAVKELIDGLTGQRGKP